MATEHPLRPVINSGNEAVSVPQKISFDHKAHADRRVDIEKEESGIFKLHLKEWEDAKKQSLLKIESYRGRCIAAKTELYQLMGFYSLFQGVVFSAVCNGSKLSCSAMGFPMALSFLTFIATAVSVHFKLAFYKTEKSKFIKAEWDVNNLNNKIYKLKLQGTDFKFEEIEDPISDSKKKARTLKLTDAMKVQKWSYIAIMFFLVLFSGTILGFCHYILCRKEK